MKETTDSSSRNSCTTHMEADGRRTGDQANGFYPRCLYHAPGLARFSGCSIAALSPAGAAALAAPRADGGNDTLTQSLPARHAQRVQPGARWDESRTVFYCIVVGNGLNILFSSECFGQLARLPRPSACTTRLRDANRRLPRATCRHRLCGKRWSRLHDAPRPVVTLPD
jgi:hypothetical protein